MNNMLQVGDYIELFKNHETDSREVCKVTGVHNDYFYFKREHHKGEFYGEMQYENCCWRKISKDPSVTPVANVGYHKAPIAKGELGQLSKIQEELDEAKDAEAQGV